MLFAKYLSLTSIMVTVAWFFWNPDGWSFEWEPLVVFFTSLGAFIAFDRKETIEASKSIKVIPSVHPADVVLLKRFLRLLPSKGTIEFLKNHDFLGSFYREDIKPIQEFLGEWGTVEHEFHDKDIEAIKQKLYEAADNFNKLIGKYTSPNKKGFQSIRPDYYDGIEQREPEFKREAGEIGDAADLVVEMHKAFIRAAKSKLDV